MKSVTSDVLVIGSGIAGLSFALKAAQHGRVALVTKKQRAESNTNSAQGGIAAVMGPDDSVGLHARDTLAAGAGLCHAGAVEALVREGPSRVRELMDWGVAFTRAQGHLSLGREGGHSRRRIVHASDLTGREIERALIAAVSAEEHISLFEDHIAVDLVVDHAGPAGARCTGAFVLDHRLREPMWFGAKVVMLATGGLCQAYRHTTNPDIATGDGVAMAYRAGAAVANLEFVQFHPTALYPADDNAFLISEAVRGEGAILRTRAGEPLMSGVHPMESLAPRDIVARSIDLVLKETGDSYALLDLSPIPPERIAERFPGILAECERRGYDPRRESLPVVPAAHYSCGGVRTDERARTSLAGLFAAGEVACTGVHGANRLASNSLLEAVVYSHRAARELPIELARADTLPDSRTGGGAQGGRLDPVDGARVEAWKRTRTELRHLMWADAGIARSDERLGLASEALTDIARDIELEFAAGELDPTLIELRNLAEVARLIVRSARQRRESRGLHYNTDHPHRDNERHLRDTVLSRDGS